MPDLVEHDLAPEEEAQVARLKYILAHGAKEGLVASPLEWPGVHSAKPMIEGGEIRGTRFNRTREYALGVKARSRLAKKSRKRRPSS